RPIDAHARQSGELPQVEVVSSAASSSALGLQLRERLPGCSKFLGADLLEGVRRHGCLEWLVVVMRDLKGVPRQQHRLIVRDLELDGHHRRGVPWVLHSYDERFLATRVIV